MLQNKEKAATNALDSLYGSPFEPGNGFLVRDLIRFFAVDIIIKMVLELLLWVDFFPSLDVYVMVILASKPALFAYLVWLIQERRNAWPETGIKSLGRWWAWPAALGIYAACFPLLMLVGRMNHSLLARLYAWVGWAYTPEPQDVVKLLFGGFLSPPLVVTLFVFAVLLGPCMEEIAFRGMGMDAIKRSGGAAAALFWTSLLFGLYHFSLAQLLPLSVLGLLFGLVRLMSGSLWCAIFIHCLHNFVVLANNARELGWWSLP